VVVATAIRGEGTPAGGRQRLRVIAAVQCGHLVDWLQVIIAFTFLVLAGVVGIIVYATLNPNQKVSGGHQWCMRAPLAAPAAAAAPANPPSPTGIPLSTGRSSTCRTPSSRPSRASRTRCRRRPRRRRSGGADDVASGQWRWRRGQWR